jgi:hypothetical protein
MKHEFLPARRTLAAWAAVLAVGIAFPFVCADADPALTKIAVFDFELDDLSAGGGIAGDGAADAAELNRAATAARRLMADSGRYALVDVSTAADEAITNHRLRECGGCEAAIARKLGADQSFLAVVTRISRTEYVVRFQIRDAQSGDVALARQSGLRMGAAYSWDRGIASLIKSSVLDNP